MSYHYLHSAYCSHLFIYFFIPHNKLPFELCDLLHSTGKITERIVTFLSESGDLVTASSIPGLSVNRTENEPEGISLDINSRTINKYNPIH